MTPTEEAPRDVYAARLAERRSEWARHDRRDRMLSLGRGIVASVGIVTALAIGAIGMAAVHVLVGLGVVFLGLVLRHERTARARRRAARAVTFYETGLARVTDAWAGHGATGQRFLDAAHPCAGDLDLFGRASLFERLSTARTAAGEEVLAAWLAAPAAPEVVRERQAAVAELRPRLELREDLAVLGAEARGAVDSSTLTAWASERAGLVPRGLRLAAALASAAASFEAWRWAHGAGRGGFVAAALLVSVLVRVGRRWTEPALRGLDRSARHLETAAALFGRMETERFTAPLLVRLAEAFAVRGARPSREIARLRRLVEIEDSKRNLLFAPVAFLLGWDVHVAAAVSAWRRRSGPLVVSAVAAFGEIEALSALAAYAFENPEDVFPTFDTEGPLFVGEALAHPLLPRARAVANDVQLDAERRLFVVTGSNMSGKSTLLRTVGISAVLAQAGAPVRARRLRLSPLAVGASIRIQDSLEHGRSRFYAEITRVRQIMDMAEARPWLLFLLDEIFHGTNSADRRVGAEAVVRALVRRDAVGFVTSHDLALAEIAASLAPAAANVHFEDHLEDGVIAFDYRLKPGPVTRSNAVALMRAVGLDV